MIRRRNIWLLVLVAALLLLASSLYWVSRPARVATLLLDQLGAALGLQITSSGASEYRLRGTPMLLLHDVVARERGGATPLLRARRVYLTLPWKTIRARGGDLTVKRVELDAPQLDLPALRHWQSTRPPSQARLPTLTEGLRINDGVLVDDGWRVDGLQAILPALYPDRPLQARLRGRYLAAPLSVPFNLAVAISRPDALIRRTTTGFASQGGITIQRDDWRMPATVSVSGPLRLVDGGLRITPLHFGMAAAYESGDTRVPFALGMSGPLHFHASTWSLAPAGVALRRRGTDVDAATDPVPTLDAHGTLALGRDLALQLDGVIAAWPAAWPVLPPPIGQSRSSLPFALRYDGKPDFSETSALQLRRDTTRFDAVFRLPQVLDWSKAAATGTPLPPIDGTLTTPKLLISGATLEGVEIEFDGGEAALR